MNIFQKQPADKLDYDLDFSDWLTGNDTISSVVATTDSTDLVVQSAQIVGLGVKVWIYGGLDGITYKVTTTISTTLGRIKELEFKIKVRQL